MEFKKRLILEAYIEADDPKTADAVMGELVKELEPNLKERCTVQGTGITGNYNGEFHIAEKAKRINGPRKLKAA